MTSSYLRYLLMPLCLATSLATAAPAVELTGARLSKARNCFSCHLSNQKILGPSYADIAKRYAGVPGAAQILSSTIRQGGVQNWSEVPMPANPQVSKEEALLLATWILAH